MKSAAIVIAEDVDDFGVLAKELANDSHNLSIQHINSTKASSEVWKHYGTLYRSGKCIDEMHFYCRHCFNSQIVKRYRSTTSTNSLRLHLSIKHKLTIKLNASRVSTSTDATSSSQSKGKLLSKRAKRNIEKKESELARDIAIWVAQDVTPLSAVCGEGFQQFCKTFGIVKEYTEHLNFSSIAQSAMNDVYNSIYDNITSVVLPSISWYSVSFDCWTDCYRMFSYLTLNLHWISTEWEMKNVCLKTSLLEEPQSTTNISTEIQALLEEYKLKKEFIVCAVTDSGANISEAIKTLDISRSDCIAYAINLLIMDLLSDERLNNVRDLIVKLQKCHRALVCRHQMLVQRHKEGADVKLIKFLQEVEFIDEVLESDERVVQGGDFDKLVKTLKEARISNCKESSPMHREVTTRWTSVLALLKMFNKNLDLVQPSLQELQLRDLDLKEDECKLIEDITEILDSVNAATEILQGSSSSTMNMVLLLRTDICRRLNEMMESTNGIKETAISILLERIEVRLSLTDENVCGAILDPSTQNLELVIEHLNLKGETKASFLKRIGNNLGVWNDITNQTESQDAVKHTVVDDTSPKWKKARLEILKKNALAARSVDDLEFEVIKYQKLCEDVMDPIEWWRKNQRTFPKLSKLARAILSIPATSTEPEQIFSESGSIEASRKSHLQPTKVDKTLFIQRNFNYISQQMSRSPTASTSVPNADSCMDPQSRCQTHECHICQRKFKKKFDRDRHLFVHNIRNSANVFDCELCEFTATRRTYLDIHFRKHRVIYACASCDKRFLSTILLRTHLETSHQVQMTTVCSSDHLLAKGTAYGWCRQERVESISPATSSSKADDEPETYAGAGPWLQRILKRLRYKRLTPDICCKMRQLFGSEECEMCGRLYRTKAELEPHLVSHQEEKFFRCTKCDYTSATKINVKWHMESAHGLESFPCDQCNYAARSRTALWHHQRQHQQHGEEAVECPECKLTFEGHAKLRRHIAGAHSQVARGERVGRKTTKCPHCDKVFQGSNRDLRKHMWIHEGIKPFKCPMCPYSCRSKFNLNSHKLSHSSERPHKCPQCDKRFKSLTAVRLHSRCHTNASIQIYACNQCEYTGTRKKHVMRHMSKHHPTTDDSQESHETEVGEAVAEEEDDGNEINSKQGSVQLLELQATDGTAVATLDPAVLQQLELAVSGCADVSHASAVNTLRKIIEQGGLEGQQLEISGGEKTGTIIIQRGDPGTPAVTDGETIVEVPDSVDGGPARFVIQYITRCD